MDKATVKRALGFAQVKSAAGWNAVCATSDRYGYHDSVFVQERVPLLGWGVGKIEPRKAGAAEEADEEERGLTMVGILPVGNRVVSCEDVFWFLGYVHDKNADDHFKRFEGEARRFEGRFEAMIRDGTIPGYVLREGVLLQEYEDEEPEPHTYWEAADAPEERLTLLEVFERERERFGFARA